MELNAAKELKLAGLVSSAHLSQEYPETELGGRRILLTEPVVLDVEYSFDGEGFTVRGELRSAVLMNCTKCNEEFVSPFEVAFSERFLRVSEEEAEELDCYTYTGETLVLDKLVQDLILLNAPMYGLCRPDCRGLCPVCGANLNNTQCTCTPDEESNPFASLKGLKELLKDD